MYLEGGESEMVKNEGQRYIVETVAEVLFLAF